MAFALPICSCAAAADGSSALSGQLVVGSWVALMHEGQTLIGFIWPAQNPELMQQLADRKVTVLSIDALPRTATGKLLRRALAERGAPASAHKAAG